MTNYESRIQLEDCKGRTRCSPQIRTSFPTFLTRSALSAAMGGRRKEFKVQRKCRTDWHGFWKRFAEGNHTTPPRELDYEFGGS